MKNICYYLDVVYSNRCERCIKVVACYYNKADNILEVYSSYNEWFAHEPSRIIRDVIDFTLFVGEY